MKIQIKPRKSWAKPENNKKIIVAHPANAQFFDDEITEVCNSLANNGVRVIVAGLDMDYEGRPFGPMANLMATAEYVTKVHAICPETGGLAQYSHRKTKSSDLIVLGKEAEYEPLSRAAYFKRKQKKTLVIMKNKCSLTRLVS